MSAQKPVKGPASYFPSIEKKYGEPIAHWLHVLEKAGPLKHMELVGHLKAEHRLGHGHANALVAWFANEKVLARRDALQTPARSSGGEG